MKRRAALLLAVVLCLEGAGVAGAAGAAGAVQAASREADAPEVRKAAVAPLRVPKLGIEGARVIPVGINERGQLAVGQSVSAVYTWNRGVRPGQPGSSVIAGHTWSRGEGVFDDLGNLRVGDRFFVGRASFVVNRVRRVRSLPPKQVRDLFSDRGPSRVVLITCGDRSATSGVYATRILVFADKV